MNLDPPFEPQLDSASPSSSSSFKTDLSPVSSKESVLDSPRKSHRKSPVRSTSNNTDTASLSDSSFTTRRRKSRPHGIDSKQFKIFRNLLILEQSLRMQYTEQQSMRFKFLIFYFVMVTSSVITFASLYLLKLTELSGVPQPGSKAGCADRNESFMKFFLFFQIITLALFHLSGEYRRTIIMPRKFLLMTNKSLRQLNVRLIKLPKSILDQCLDGVKFCLLTIISSTIFVIESAVPKRGFFITRNLFYIKDLLKLLKMVKLRLILLHLTFQSDDQINLNSNFNIKLVLNSRVFTSVIRENWELFRNEFWIKEFNRRVKLIYGISFDSDIVAIEKLVLNNEEIKKPEEASESTARDSSEVSRSPNRSSITLTPTTSSFLKNIDESVIDDKVLMNKSELVRRDRDDRKTRRKSITK